MRKTCSTARCAVGDRAWIGAAYDGSPAGWIKTGWPLTKAVVDWRSGTSGVLSAAAWPISQPCERGFPGWASGASSVRAGDGLSAASAGLGAAMRVSWPRNARTTSRPRKGHEPRIINRVRRPALLITDCPGVRPMLASNRTSLVSNIGSAGGSRKPCGLRRSIPNYTVPGGRC